MRLALYQPDIPQNAGTLIRTAACLGLPVDIVEPCGFLLGDRHFRRAGLDYMERAVVMRHRSWPSFEAFRLAGPGRRLILLTTAGTTTYTRFRFRADDIVMVGRETGGVPPEVHAAADARLRIPMVPAERSLNVAVAAAMVLGEALRQTAWAEETAAFGPGMQDDVREHHDT
ncbi:MAG: tRNA (cytidine(34)-2'-O)-methyltransferase [Rhodospirillales bacterium]|nr:MAG: tRNA (cytidine(34)-2'-O)-methyltransferase [Rhodospirillales bacterium]